MYNNAISGRKLEIKINGITWKFDGKVLHRYEQNTHWVFNGNDWSWKSGSFQQYRSEWSFRPNYDPNDRNIIWSFLNDELRLQDAYKKCIHKFDFTDKEWKMIHTNGPNVSPSKLAQQQTSQFSQQQVPPLAQQKTPPRTQQQIFQPVQQQVLPPMQQQASQTRQQQTYSSTHLQAPSMVQKNTLSSMQLMLDCFIDMLQKEEESKEFNNIIMHMKTLNKNISALDNPPAKGECKQWLEDTPDIYWLMEHDGEELFERLLVSVQTILPIYKKLEKLQKTFKNVWEEAVSKLDKCGIHKVSIAIDEMVVTDAELNVGWKVKNSKKRYVDDTHCDLMVYEILSPGIVADGKLIRPPIVNVYTQQPERFVGDC